MVPTQLWHRAYVGVDLQQREQRQLCVLHCVFKLTVKGFWRVCQPSNKIAYEKGSSRIECYDTLIPFCSRIREGGRGNVFLFYACKCTIRL